MNYQQTLKDNEIYKFEDVSKFLEVNNIKVKQRNIQNPPIVRCTII